MQCCNIYYSFTQFQDGFNYEQARLEEDAVMQQKYKVLSFAIVAALYIFLVPSTSDAMGNWKATHTPGETVGKHIALPPMQIHDYKNYRPYNLPAEDVDFIRLCRNMLSGTTWVTPAPFIKGVHPPAPHQRSGLGTDIRYIQYTAKDGYCYYYHGGTSSGRSGPATWRYDPAVNDKEWER